MQYNCKQQQQKKKTIFVVEMQQHALVKKKHTHVMVNFTWQHDRISIPG